VTRQGGQLTRGPQAEKKFEFLRHFRSVQAKSSADHDDILSLLLTHAYRPVIVCIVCPWLSLLCRGHVPRRGYSKPASSSCPSWAQW